MKKLLFLLLVLASCKPEPVPPIVSTWKAKDHIPGTSWLSYDKIQATTGNRAQRWHEFTDSAYTLQTRIFHLDTDSLIFEGCLSRNITEWRDSAIVCSTGEECSTGDPGGKALRVEFDYLKGDSLHITTFTDGINDGAPEGLTRL